MAVYTSTYKGYEGPLTAEWSRFLVLTREAYQRVFRSRLLLIFFVLCFVPHVAAAVIIYFTYNVNALQSLGLPVRGLGYPVRGLVPIDAWFFYVLLGIERAFSFILVVFTGPGLVSPDLANNALPLYFSRPFSRSEYVLGKMAVLAVLLSLITWIPVTVLFFLQSSLAGRDWMWTHIRVLPATIGGSALWIVFVSLLALAVSAWIKWKPVAGALLFVIFFAAAAFGEAVKATLLTRWGDLFNLVLLMERVWEWLFFGVPAKTVVFTVNGVRIESIPVWSAWVTLMAICVVCLFLLAKKIRACEVVR